DAAPRGPAGLRRGKPALRGQGVRAPGRGRDPDGRPRRGARRRPAGAARAGPLRPVHDAAEGERAGRRHPRARGRRAPVHRHLRGNAAAVRGQRRGAGGERAGNALRHRAPHSHGPAAAARGLERRGVHPRRRGRSRAGGRFGAGAALVLPRALVRRAGGRQRDRFGPLPVRRRLRQHRRPQQRVGNPVPPRKEPGRRAAHPGELRAAL
ncbi:MAG: Imidazole glycerol phosphate synthase amidotransferase subunit, partial [uncultured Gemmatimonadetes bacterium]